MGEVIEVPEHIEPTGTNFIDEMSKLREHQHILAIYWSEWNRLSAFLARRLIVYGERIVTLWEDPEYGSSYRNHAGIISRSVSSFGIQAPSAILGPR